MSRGPMESNKEEMRVAEVVEEVVDSMEEEVSDFKDAKGLGDPWERISGTEVAVKIASDGGESIFSMVSKDRNVLCSDPGHCCRPMLYLPLSNCCSLPPFDLTSYTTCLGDVNFALKSFLKYKHYKQCS